MSQQSASPATLPLLDTDVLRTFVAIAESGSFTRAAQQVFRTPSALSMQIKRLEETLGQPLFLREARQVRLTPEGEVLLSFGRRLLKLNEEAVSQFLAPSLEGKVRFGTPDDVRHADSTGLAGPVRPLPSGCPSGRGGRSQCESDRSVGQ